MCAQSMQTVICSCWSPPITPKFVQESVMARELTKLGSIFWRYTPLIRGILVSEKMREAKTVKAARITRLQLLAHAVVAEYLRIRALASHQIKCAFLLTLTASQIRFNKTALSL